MKLGKNDVVLFSGDSITEGVEKPFERPDSNDPEDFGCIFVPLYDKIYEQAKRSRMEYFIWDGTHPGIAGHMLIAEEWLKAVEEND